MVLKRLILDHFLIGWYRVILDCFYIGKVWVVLIGLNLDHSQ